MTTREEAQRLADALDDEFNQSRVSKKAAALLRQWPEAGEPRQLLEQALERMDRAREILTDGKPRPECNWGLLATEDIRAQLAAPSQQPAPASPDEFVCPHCFDEGAAPQAAQSGMVPPDNDDVLWLWKDGDKMLAFRHLYPCYSPGGDPMTLGEPWGKAIFRHSHDRAAAPQAVPQPQPLTGEQEKALSAEAKTGLIQHTTPINGSDMQSGQTRELSGNRSAGSTPPPPDTAWLIEWQAHGHGPQWWGFNHTPAKNADWCADANNAIRFSRREDAERMRLHVIAVAGFAGRPDYQRQMTVTEHMWPAAAPQAVPQPLTDEQIDKLADRLWEQGHIQSLSKDTGRIFARAVIAALGITAKGGGNG